MFSARNVLISAHLIESLVTEKHGKFWPGPAITVRLREVSIVVSTVWLRQVSYSGVHCPAKTGILRW